MTVNIDNDVLKVCRCFNIKGEAVSQSVFTDGHINTTQLVVFNDGDEDKKYLIQGINTHVFKNPEELMENIVNVTSYLRKKIAENGGDPNRETLTFLKAENGKYFYFEGDKCWRAYNFIDSSHTCNKIENKVLFENAGRSFGNFQRYLTDYPMHTLNETIKNFHNTPVRFDNLEIAIEKNTAGRADSVKAETDFAMERRCETDRLLELYRKGLIPLRVTHNDTKLNNILFDDETNEGICVIDLDTIMPGFSLYDFGDAIRYGANTTKEDDENLDNVGVSLELFESYTEGFLSACAKALTMAEVENLAFSAKLMTLECGTRFLTDYLDGDVYFKTSYPEHNLVRARNQFRLVSEIEKHLDEMQEIVMNIYKKYI
ncbi:MAG: aminoglycoside phosphotransferase family protein [Clostridia bacterium]|nr:aminoglycoside phosphotransferase family protein [Clostridia bacterium]